jgi:hypothetical protein
MRIPIEAKETPTSHSHFTHPFRAVFGVTPSHVRGWMAAADLGALLPLLSA